MIKLSVTIIPAQGPVSGREACAREANLGLEDMARARDEPKDDVFWSERRREYPLLMSYAMRLVGTTALSSSLTIFSKAKGT